MNKTRVQVAVAIATGAFSVAAIAGSCIVSGWPAANPSSSASSAATSLETGSYRTEADMDLLEARFRTRQSSPGVKLRSDEFKGGMIIIR